MERPTMLTKALVHQCARDLGLSAERDVQTIAHRVEHEGFAFLAITLPTLSDALERGLEAGLLSCPSAFARHGRLPRFLGGFFSRVFERSSGRLLPDPDVEAIFAIRQICRFWKKPKMECSPAMNRVATQRFKDVEADLGQLSSHVLREDITLDQVSRILWSQVFPILDSHSLVCGHGPGVTAERYLPNERYRIREWYTRSESSFPPDLHAFHNLWAAWGSYGEEGCESGLSGIRFLDIRDEPGVRVVFVPKTLSGPRVIAIEPSAMQYMQQGLMRYVVAQLESHRLTARSIRFRDQGVNQSLAYQSSIDRSRATLDLKDASDRVHLLLVQRIFQGCGIAEYLDDARSLHADLPDGSNLVLNKYASMGSALCFPVESMVFYTLIQSAMHKRDGKRPTTRSIRKYSELIDIYGDDIIVPVEYADAVSDGLESYGLKVNSNKSFRYSLFRESCGGDFFAGRAVKPIYAREYPHADRGQWTANTVMSWVSTADQFYMAGMWQMAQTIRDMLESVLRRRIPRSRVQTRGVGFASLMFDTDCRWQSDTQSWAQKRIVYTPSKRKDIIDDDAIACFNRLLGTSRAPVRKGKYFDVSPRGVVEMDTGSRFLDAVDRPVDSERVECVGMLPNVLGSVVTGPQEHTHRRSDNDNSWAALGSMEDAASGSSAGSAELSSVRNLRRIRVRSSTINRIIDDTFGEVDSLVDLTSSVKRGAFKSKRRWVTVFS